MAEEASFGVRRLRQAITNQATCGSGQFELSIDSADRLCREIEDELARAEGSQLDAYVKLPLDADGEPIRIGDVLYSGGNELRVLSITVKAGEAYVGVHTDEGVFLPSVNPKYLSRKNPEPLESEPADSWELLEKDVRNAENGGACGYYGLGTEPCNEGCPGYKDLETHCEAIALKDALLRAKALAERDAKGAEQ